MSTLKVDFIKNRVGTGAVELSEGATIPSGKNLTIGGNATVTGNLTVNGTTTTISTTNTTISDKLLELGTGTTGTPSGDAGIIVERGNQNNVGVIWDETQSKWFFSSGTFTGASTGDLTTSTKVGISAGDSTFGIVQGSSITSTGSMSSTGDLTVDTDALFVDSSLDQTQVGFAGTLTGGDGSTAQATKCRLAIIGSGAGYNGGPLLTLLIGADGASGGTKTLTDATSKECRVGLPHYLNNERPMNLFYAQCANNIGKVMFGSGTSSMNAPMQYSFAVGQNNTTEDSTNFCLKIEGATNVSASGSRLELWGGVSEEFEGNWATDKAGTPTFDCSTQTMHYYQLNGNITKINLTGVDTSNGRATTVQIMFSIGGSTARTIAGTNGVTINGGSDKDLRWAGFSASSSTTYTSPANGITILTLVVTSDTGGNQRVFGFTSDGH